MGTRVLHIALPILTDVPPPKVVGVTKTEARHRELDEAENVGAPDFEKDAVEDDRFCALTFCQAIETSVRWLSTQDATLGARELCSSFLSLNCFSRPFFDMKCVYPTSLT